LSDVSQLVRPFLVPPQVPRVRVNWGGVQFGDWMYSLAKYYLPPLRIAAP
jgi:hypothetical protein